MSIAGEDGKKSCSREPPMFNGSVVKWHKKKTKQNSPKCKDDYGQTIEKTVANREIFE